MQQLQKCFLAVFKLNVRPVFGRLFKKYLNHVYVPAKFIDTIQFSKISKNTAEHLLEHQYYNDDDTIEMLLPALYITWGI